MWAAHWLVQDLDGETLRTLAGLDGRDPNEVRDVLAEALADTGTPMPSRSDAVKTVYTDMARCCLAGQVSERWLVSMIEQLVIEEDDPGEMLAAPLGALYGLDDEWGAGWGRTEPQLIAAVQAACAQQVALGRNWLSCASRGNGVMGRQARAEQPSQVGQQDESDLDG
ncbi:hypothetical protein IL992_17810 [Microbispora sp. NEAU-D428]|uniref:hypothetical protein n=1 Tax=Microbispora sitophila TaxID=2771537 RepID=UPI0018684DC3|nr:hypothetical protein [Microbispora sitophila]MBE3011032.1 hypothetical protein [Microbispora sitophila]